MQSFRTNNMPSGAATAIFNAFIEGWSRAKGYVEEADERLVGIHRETSFSNGGNVWQGFFRVM
jgi:hypothetical protein